LTKRDVVALAEMLRIHNRTADARTEFTPDHLRVLGDFCAAQYPNFNRERWIDYIAGVNRGESSPKKGKIGPRFIASKKPEQKALQSLLRQLRMGAGLRQKDIAEALGKRPAFVSYYETGARRLDLLELREVCKVLGTSLDVFVRKFEKRLLDPSLPALSKSTNPPRRLPGRRLKQLPLWTCPFRQWPDLACPLLVFGFFLGLRVAFFQKSSLLGFTGLLRSQGSALTGPDSDAGWTETREWRRFGSFPPGQRGHSTLLTPTGLLMEGRWAMYSLKAAKPAPICF